MSVSIPKNLSRVLLDQIEKTSPEIIRIFHSIFFTKLKANSEIGKMRFSIKSCYA